METKNIEYLISGMTCSPDDFRHLQVFLHREKDNDSRPDNFFLMVTPRVFGKVEVLDLKVEGDSINIEFLDCTMNEDGNVRISILDENQSVLLICWQDIRKMVLDETTSGFSNNELLEFEF